MVFEKSNWLNEFGLANDRLMDYTMHNLVKDGLISVKCSACDYSGQQKTSAFSYGNGICPFCAEAKPSSEQGHLVLNEEPYLEQIEKLSKAESGFVSREETIKNTEKELAEKAKIVAKEQQEMALGVKVANEKVEKLEERLTKVSNNYDLAKRELSKMKTAEPVFKFVVKGLDSNGEIQHFSTFNTKQEAKDYLEMIKKNVASVEFSENLTGWSVEGKEVVGVMQEAKEEIEDSPMPSSWKRKTRDEIKEEQEENESEDLDSEDSDVSPEFIAENAEKNKGDE